MRGHPGPRGCSVRGRARKGGGVWAAHLQDERVLKHGIAHDPQPLVLHSRPDVCHGQRPSWGWADLTDGMVHRLLLLPWPEVLVGAFDLWHPGGRRESTWGPDAARFPAAGPLGALSGLLGPHYLDPGVGTGRRSCSGTGCANLWRALVSGNPNGPYKSLRSLRASSGHHDADGERRENQDYPFRKNGTVCLHGDGTPTVLGGPCLF